LGPSHISIIPVSRLPPQHDLLANLAIAVVAVRQTDDFPAGAERACIVIAAIAYVSLPLPRRFFRARLLL
jgi:hypothetical protein